MIDILHDLAVRSLYIVLISIAMGAIAIVIAGVYFIINEVRRSGNR